MTSNSSPERRERVRSQRARKRARPLDETALRDLALSYAARFATTGAKLEAYLARKIRESGVAEDADGRTSELDMRAIVARLIDLGYVDDTAYARMKTRDLTARGYGARRVEQALFAAGVDEGVRRDTSPGETRLREAAVLLARKRRFGPFAHDHAQEMPADEAHKAREKQVAAMLRAGHRFEHARFILDASDTAMLEQWLAEALAEEDGGDF